LINEPESWKHLPAQFGDRVKIRTAAETEAAGIAGRSGVIYGTTTVSITGVDVIGSPTEDVALSVAIDESEETVWLAPSLVEFIDHNAGATIVLDGVPKEWTRDASGNWIESKRRLPSSKWVQWLKGLLRKYERLIGNDLNRRTNVSRRPEHDRPAASRE
jgi:hypothetical protein